MKLFFLIVITFFGLSFFSCNKEVTTDIVMKVSPSTLHIKQDVGKYVNFVLDVKSNVAINHFIITQSIDNMPATNIMDSSIYVKDLVFDFNYKVPNIKQAGEHEIKLVFIVNDSDGNEKREARLILTKSIEYAIPEISGNEMYSRLASNKNAYDLINFSPLNYLTASSEIKHIQDNTIDSLQTDSSLSRIWISPAGLKFVRYNSFDYANATNLSVKNSFDSGVKVNFLSNVSKEDIILTYIPTAHLDSAYYAIKIIYVIDDVGVDKDKYIFNVKH